MRKLVLAADRIESSPSDEDEEGDEDIVLTIVHPPCIDRYYRKNGTTFLPRRFQVMFESQADPSGIAPVITRLRDFLGIVRLTIGWYDTKQAIINDEAKCQSALIRRSYCPIDMRVFGSGKCAIRARNGGVSQ